MPNESSPFKDSVVLKIWQTGMKLICVKPYDEHVCLEGRVESFREDFGLLTVFGDNRYLREQDVPQQMGKCKEVNHSL